MPKPVKIPPTSSPTPSFPHKQRKRQQPQCQKTPVSSKIKFCATPWPPPSNYSLIKLFKENLPCNKTPLFSRGKIHGARPPTAQQSKPSPRAHNAPRTSPQQLTSPTTFFKKNMRFTKLLYATRPPLKQTKPLPMARNNSSQTRIPHARPMSSSKPPLFPKKTENGQAIFFKKRETNDTLF